MPPIIGDRKVLMLSEIVEAEILLLIYSDTLEMALAFHDFQHHTSSFSIQKVEMRMVRSSHSCNEFWLDTLGNNKGDANKKN